MDKRKVEINQSIDRGIKEEKDEEDDEEESIVNVITTVVQPCKTLLKVENPRFLKEKEI